MELKTDPVKYALLWAFGALVSLAMGYCLGHFEPILSGDEADYIARGAALTIGSPRGLHDAFRPPGLVVVVSLAHFLVGSESVVLAMRGMGAMVGGALMPIAYASLRDLAGKRRLVASLAVGLWPPLHYHDCMVLAEPYAHVLLGLSFLFAYNIIREEGEGVGCSFVGLGCSISAATLFKANMLLSGALTCAVCLMSIPRAARARCFGLVGVAFIVLILPWLMFVNASTGEIKLTTTGGYNLLIGTGVHSFEFEYDSDSLPGRYLHERSDVLNWLTDDEHLILDELDQERKTNPATALVLDQLALGKAEALWREHPGRLLCYSAIKVMHSHGGSFRGLADWGIMCLMIVSMGVALMVMLPADRVLVYWCRIHFAAFLGTVLLAAVFIPNIRIKTSMFDYSAVILVALASGKREDFQWGRPQNPRV